MTLTQSLEQYLDTLSLGTVLDIEFVPRTGGERTPDLVGVCGYYSGHSKEGDREVLSLLYQKDTSVVIQLIDFLKIQNVKGYTRDGPTAYERGY